MARNAHSYAKRQLEMEKKKKADEKRQRRLDRKAGLLNADPEEGAQSDTVSTQDEQSSTDTDDTPPVAES